jgi:hypothetical protein
MRATCLTWTILCAFLLAALPAAAAEPVAAQRQVLALDKVDALVFPSLNTELLRWEDEEREAMGQPPRFAVAKDVSVTPTDTVEVTIGCTPSSGQPPFAPSGDTDSDPCTVTATSP